MMRGVQAVKARASPATTFLCLSNSNSVFIDTILRVSPPTHLSTPRSLSHMLKSTLSRRARARSTTALRTNSSR